MRRPRFTIVSRAGITAAVTGSPRHRNPEETTMFTRTTFIAALALAGTLTFAANASAASGGAGWWQGAVRQSPVCPPNHSYQECFYGG